MPPVGFPAGGFYRRMPVIQDNASFTFLHRIEEVELNIEDGRWQSDLALALSLFYRVGNTRWQQTGIISQNNLYQLHGTTTRIIRFKSMSQI